MKTILVLAGLFMTLLFCSCQKDYIKRGKNIDYSKIAGTWKAENAFWQIVISKDGKITSAIIQMGEATVKPNETTYIEMKDGKISSFKSGDFSLIYDQERSEMEITLNIERIQVQFLNMEIKGKNKVLIGGVISENGKEWNADVFEFFDYGPRFPRDDENGTGISYRFIKQADQ